MAKMNRYERMMRHQQKVEASLKGSGLYVYENNSNSSLTLPKPLPDGRKEIGPREQFEGDSYYMMLVKPPLHMLRYIKEISPAEGSLSVTNEPVVETVINEETQKLENEVEMHSGEKLILDQPDIVTNEGTVEHLVKQKGGQLNDAQENELSKEILLNENPMDGVEIIL